MQENYAGMDVKWYAVRTRSRHEQKVCVRLEKEEITAFLPKVEVWSRRRDRKKKITQALFPGYLFVECAMTNECWLRIVKVSGVAGLLGASEGKPTPIPHEQIEAVKKITESGFTPRPHPYLNSGDKVVVKEGSLTGAVGYFVRGDGKQGQLVVSVDILGRSVEVDIEMYMVEKF